MCEKIGEVEQYLVATRDILRSKYFWTKHVRAVQLDPDGVTQYCLLGALEQAVHGKRANRIPVELQAQTFMAEAITALGYTDLLKAETVAGNPNYRVAGFNDKQTTQHEDVIEVLNTAIWAARKAGV